MSRDYINQHLIISEIAKEREDLTRRQVAEVYETFINKIEEALAEGKEVVLTRFLKFELVDRDAKVKFNPQNGEAVNVPAKTVVRVRNRNRLHNLTTLR